MFYQNIMSEDLFFFLGLKITNLKLRVQRQTKINIKRRVLILHDRFHGGSKLKCTRKGPKCAKIYKTGLKI